MEEAVSRQVIRCAFEVSNRLGAGFLEKVYENALCIEFGRMGLGFSQQQPLRVYYRDRQVGEYIADILVENKLLIEVKAAKGLSSSHSAQIMNYLRATDIAVGLLLNFGRPRLEVKRVVWKHNETEII